MILQIIKYYVLNVIQKKVIKLKIVLINKKIYKMIKYIKNNFYSIIGVFSIGFLLSNIIIQLYFDKKVEITPTKSIVIQNKQKSKIDILSLENGGQIGLELIGNSKIIYITYKDFECILKNKRKLNRLKENINALFERMK